MGWTRASEARQKLGHVARQEPNRSTHTQWERKSEMVRRQRRRLCDIRNQMVSSSATPNRIGRGGGGGEPS